MEQSQSARSPWIVTTLSIFADDLRRARSAPQMKLIRYKPEFQEPMLALHRSAIEGFDLGMSQRQDEADLLDLELVYIRNGGEFLLGFIGPRLIAMGGFKRLSNTDAELKRMRIARDLQGQGYGTILLRELERRAWQAGVHNLCLEAAKRRPLTLEFYRKHDYQESGRGFYGAIETVRFTKTLPWRTEAAAHGA
jgi:GNAT superfamily N-acetyltransferase